MFGLFKKKNETIEIYSPLNGESRLLCEVDDAVFSQKMVGDGMAVLPSDGKLYAPVDGTLVQVFKTKHAYAITTSEGVEILIHCGLDTVELHGEGFTAFKKSGDPIRKGELLAEIDLDFLRAQGKDIVTPVVITNSDAFSFLIPTPQVLRAGEPLFGISKK